MIPPRTTAHLFTGDALTVLRTLPDASARCCVTSPPYWGLRNYGVSGQLGLEASPEVYVEGMVEVFREVRRVLTDDGTLWLNLGDSYATGGGRVGTAPGGGKQGENWKMRGKMMAPNRMPLPGLKPKDLIGIPWRVAFALQADGWYLRSDIIWAKPNPMPESVTDRPTKAHEYLFLLSKQGRYYYNAEAIAEPVAPSTVERMNQPNLEHQAGSDRVPGKTNGNMKAVVKKQDEAGGRRYEGFNARWAARVEPLLTRNARTVWTIHTQAYTEAHFATFPEEIPRRCILAGSAPGDIVLDPFSGSGTTAAVAVGLGRSAVGIELNPAYQDLARHRIGPLLCEDVA